MDLKNLGKYQPKMNLDPIRVVLGDNIPDIVNHHGHPTPLGRFRLMEALRNKFGDNHRNIPAAKQVMEHFDKEHDYFQKLRRIQGGY